MLARRPQRRSKGSAILAVIAVAAGLGGVAGILARYDDSPSDSAEIDRLAMQPRREPSPATATSGRGETTTATASKHGVAGQRYVRVVTRFVRKGTGGSSPPSGVRRQAGKRPRPAAFDVVGAPKEPLDEITLPARARHLGAWLTGGRRPTAANQRHWLYQHAWIVTGAKFGWWHGAEALRVLIRVDGRIESQWGIGYRSEAVARRALAAVEARAK